MPDSKTYLNVPYAQKDEAKALGARWDANNKKWYAPSNKDITLFAKWSTVALNDISQSSASNPSSANNKRNTSNDKAAAVTHPTIKNFAAYDGDEPPWD